MEQHYKNFVATLHYLVSDLNRYYPTTGATKLLECYDKLNIAKVIFKVNNILKLNSTLINNKNVNIFNKTLILLPDIDLSIYWTKLTAERKDKLWTYLKILLIESDILMNFNQQHSSTEPTSLTPKIVADNVITDSEKKKDEFNPYIGVGSNDINFGVGEVMSITSSIVDEPRSAPGLETMVSLFGIDKMIDMNSLTEQLKNLKKEDIDMATDSLKNYLGMNINDKTSELISDMITSISSELSNMNSDKPLTNILKIAESVAIKMKPKISQQNIDIHQLLNSTQSLASQCKDNDGNPLFKDNMNPFNLINQLASGNQNMTEKDYSEKCNEMLKQLGGDTINFEEIIKQQHMQQQNKNRNRKKK